MLSMATWAVVYPDVACKVYLLLEATASHPLAIQGLVDPASG